MTNDTYFAKEIVAYYKEYAVGKGIPVKVADASIHILRQAFETADPDFKIEQVFDRVLSAVYPVAYMPRPAPEPKPDVVVDVYEDLRKRMGWATDAQIKAEAAIQASEVIPSQDFYEWLHDALERYNKGLAKALRESEESGSEDPMEAFQEAYLTSSQIWSDTEDESDVPASRLGEPVVVYTCLDDPVDRFVEADYEPSTQYPIDLKMRTSFTNRLRGIDWNYYLQVE